MILQRGQYRACIAQDEADLRLARSFRAKCFGVPALLARDAYDDRCTHLLVRHANSGQLVGYFRCMTQTPAKITSSYSAQFYDLSVLRDFEGPMIEMGRFCLASDPRDADILRLTWGALAKLVDEAGARMLFGCTSFSGTSPAPYADALTYLGDRHVGPARFRPAPRAPRVFPLPVGHEVDTTHALRSMPPILRSYLAMGGWVSDHAVADPDMNTLHVFTAVEVAKIPPMRKKLLRALY